MPAINRGTTDPGCAEQDRYAFCPRRAIPKSSLQKRIPNELDDGKVFLTVSKGFLTLWAEVFELGVAIRKHIALDNTSIPQTGRLVTP
jgi:hypothetical protein